MIRTKNLIVDISEVPVTWIFENYLPGFAYKLTGQDIMIKSPFNPEDKIPSTSVYLWKNTEYRFNDFSTGIKGGAIDLVMELYKIGYYPACIKIIQDYNRFVLEGNEVPVTLFRQRAKYKPIDYPKRKWIMQDNSYWGQYSITEANCTRLNILPLESYTLSNGQHKLTVQGFHIYGFFTKEGDLYKIYQPMVKDRKFMKIKSHVQGLDQLERKSPLLMITKAIKDVACLHNMGYEAIAPDSENMLLPKGLSDDLKKDYPSIVTLFDNDSMGIKGMQRYQEEYGFPYVVSDMEKDPSDSVKRLGGDKVKEELTRLIKEKI